MTISIITPWHGETHDLCNDYYTAVQGGPQVITIDNACPHATATTLVEMTDKLGGEYMRNAENAGFAAANNQGYAKATGDIVIFLNSDVAAAGPWLEAVAADVRDGALYGPSLNSQLVAGRHVPYLEGWCIAATRATWERLCDVWSPGYVTKPSERRDGKRVRVLGENRRSGPWDADAYPGPYWEDNDLCLRALQRGINLVQTAWPIQHKGGRTAGPIIKHGAAFAANEATFTARVLAAMREPEMTEAWQRYMAAYHTQSDIQQHLGLLYSLARGNVVELGTRSGNSTAALLAGVEARGGHVWSVDLMDCSRLFDDAPLWTFIRGDSRDPRVPARIGEQSGTPIDVLFIDTEHVYEITQAELTAWAPLMRAGGTILLHDIETFPGVRRAVREFCAERGWRWTAVLPNNGMAVVEVPE